MSQDAGPFIFCYNIYMKNDKKAFTLIELLVVISIIGLLSTFATIALSSARKKARDTKRKNDLEQIRTAMELYFDDHNEYPREAGGANGKIGEGAGLDTQIAPYMPNVPHDPLGPGNANYYYYYDALQWCDGTTIAVVFARRVESIQGNGPTYCQSWGGEGGAGQPEAYHVVIGASSG